MSPYKFKSGDFIKSVYSGLKYTVVEADKKGMAQLLNMFGRVETWNAYCNDHFVKSDNQLTLF